MTDLIAVSANDADRDFSSLLARVRAGGDGFLITQEGQPVARLLPVEARRSVLTPEQQADHDDLLREKFHLGGERLDRDELHER